jgi:hypothetical protein
MPDQNDRAILLRDHALSVGDVLSQRPCRMLADADFVAVVLQYMIDGLPTGSVDERAMYENDVVYSISFGH